MESAWHRAAHRPWSPEMTHDCHHVSGARTRADQERGRVGPCSEEREGPCSGLLVDLLNALSNSCVLSICSMAGCFLNAPPTCPCSVHGAEGCSGCQPSSQGERRDLLSGLPRAGISEAVGTSIWIHSLMLPLPAPPSRALGATHPGRAKGTKPGPFVFP